MVVGWFRRPLWTGLRGGLFAAPLLICLAASGANAQERISTRLVPSPDQTVQTELRQVMNAETAALGSQMKIHVELVSALTMKVGTPDSAGNLVVDVTLNSSTATADMNGTPLPLPSPLAPGQKATVTFAPDGSMNVSTPDGQQAMLAIGRTLFDAGVGGNTGETVGVGETFKRPLDATVPVPGVPTGTMGGEMQRTLVSVTRDGTGRIASFTQSVSGTMSGGAIMPTQGALILKGSGTTEWNLDRGVARATDLQVEFSTETSTAGTPMTLQGTVVSSVRNTF